MSLDLSKITAVVNRVVEIVDLDEYVGILGPFLIQIAFGEDSFWVSLLLHLQATALKWLVEVFVRVVLDSSCFYLVLRERIRKNT